MDWIDLAQNMDRWLALVNTVKKLLVVYMQGLPLLAEEMFSVSKGLCCISYLVS
jgi:hypothetical protein